MIGQCSPEIYLEILHVRTFMNIHVVEGSVKSCGGHSAIMQRAGETKVSNIQELWHLGSSMILLIIQPSNEYL